MKYSVIIPNYNNEQWIGKCLESVLNQTYQDTEIIVIDDMSSDGSVSVVNGLLREQDRLIRLKSKRLQGGARNAGIVEASGEYLIFLDSDDWLLSEDCIERADKFICGQDVAFVGIRGYKHGKYDVEFVPNYLTEWEAFTTSWTGSSAKIVKRSLALECLYDEGNRMEDRVQHYRVCLGMKSFICIPILFSAWNKDNTTSITTLRDGKWHNTIWRHLANYLDLLEEIPLEDTKHRTYLNRKVREIKDMAERGGDLQL